MPDALTGLATTRDLAARADALDGHAIWIDLDGLIWINDQFGYEAGDAALRAVAEAMQAELGDKQQDLYRVGGDEFIVLLRAEDAPAAIALATRIRDRVDALAIPYRRNDRPQADRLRINAAVFTIDRTPFRNSLRGGRFSDPCQGMLADAVHAEKCRLGVGSGIVLLVA